MQGLVVESRRSGLASAGDVEVEILYLGLHHNGGSSAGSVFVAGSTFIWPSSILNPVGQPTAPVVALRLIAFIPRSLETLFFFFSLPPPSYRVRQL